MIAERADRRRRRASGGDTGAADPEDVYGRSRQRLIEWGLWQLPDLDTVRARISEATGRPVVVSAMPLGAQSISGMLVVTDDVDYVVHESETSRFHQDHIVLHELGHLVWGHPGIVTASVDHTAVAQVFGRADYDDPHEREAETIASLMGRFLRPTDAAPVRDADPAMLRVLQSFGIAPGR